MAATVANPSATDGAMRREKLARFSWRPAAA